jgi:uncharacterized membrane protein YuzA (DUF378 family)
MAFFSWLAYFITSIGAINWGLVHFFKLNLVEYVCDMIKVEYLRESLYGIISIAGLYSLLSLFV